LGPALTSAPFFLAGLLNIGYDLTLFQSFRAQAAGRDLTPRPLSSLEKGSPTTQGDDTMKWITRSHVHVDRVACPWLITRFVDNEAEFLFVPKSQVDKVAAEVGAIPFDAPGVELGHHEGRCSFESIILKYGLTDPALQRMAKIVHAADVAEDIDTDPLARGLEAIASGYSLRYPDDEENLAHQLEVYDALYAWCRLQVAKEK
jgi:hypothetical protein